MYSVPVIELVAREKRETVDHKHPAFFRLFGDRLPYPVETPRVSRCGVVTVDGRDREDRHVAVKRFGFVEVGTAILAEFFGRTPMPEIVGTVGDRDRIGVVAVIAEVCGREVPAADRTVHGVGVENAADPVGVPHGFAIGVPTLRDRVAEEEQTVLEFDGTDVGRVLRVEERDDAACVVRQPERDARLGVRRAELIDQRDLHLGLSVLPHVVKADGSVVDAVQPHVDLIARREHKTDLGRVGIKLEPDPAQRLGSVTEYLRAGVPTFLFLFGKTGKAEASFLFPDTHGADRDLFDKCKIRFHRDPPLIFLFQL